MKLFKQIWSEMRRQPLISAVTVLGTSLTIFLIMMVVMLQEVKTMPFSPESNRDRFLHGKYAHFEFPETNGSASMRPYRLHNKYLYGKRLG